MNMLTRLTQSTPHNTPLHRVDVRCKLLLVIVASISIFWVDTWMGLMFHACSIVVLWRFGQLSVWSLIDALKSCSIIVVLVMAVHALVWIPTSDASSVSFMLGSPPTLGLSIAGAQRGAYFVIRIFLLVLYAALFSATSSTSQIASALAQLMMPLKRFGLPVHDVITVVHIALRFMPETGAEIDRIALAQRARGVHTTQRNLIKRIGAWLPLFVALIVALFHRADDLAYALDARLYSGDDRTYLGLESPGVVQLMATAVSAVALIILACIA